MRQLVQRVHADERGAVALETILLIGAIALPILIFLLRFGWPSIREFFVDRVEEAQNEADRAAGTM